MRRYLQPLLLAFAFLLAQADYTAHLVTHLVAPPKLHQDHTQSDICLICVGYSHPGSSSPLAFELFQPPLMAAIQDCLVPDQPDAKPIFSPVSQARAPPLALV